VSLCVCHAARGSGALYAHALRDSEGEVAGSLEGVGGGGGGGGGRVFVVSIARNRTCLPFADSS